jgi:hypothetical protein
MQEDLQEERRSTERRWAKREKTIQKGYYQYLWHVW